jgi:hypothetical protein
MWSLNMPMRIAALKTQQDKSQLPKETVTEQKKVVQKGDAISYLPKPPT